MNINGSKTAILVGAVLAALLSATGCSTADAPKPPADDADGGLTFSIAVNADTDKSRCLGNVHSDRYIHNQDNFASITGLFELQMHRYSNNAWGQLPSGWLVKFADGWHPATLSPVKPDAVSNKQFTIDDFTRTSEYWNIDIIDFYGAAGFNGCRFNEGIPRISWADDGHENRLSNFTTWCEHPIDLIWTFKREQRQAADWNRPVNLTFNHAMSRLTFSFRNTNPDLVVEVRDVYLGNVYRRANLSISGARDIYFNGSSISDDLPAAHDRVTESNLNDMWYGHTFKCKQDVRWGMKTITLDGVTESQSAESNPGGSYYFLVIPQRVDRWNHADPSHRALTAQATSQEYSNPFTLSYTNELPAYLMVNCVIKNRNTGRILWESRNYDNENNQGHWNGTVYCTDYERLNGIVLPLTPAGQESYTWLPSRSYNYQIVFGEGAGWDSEGDPVLVPISLTATVAPFDTENWYIPAN